jgi:DmsE family decaheme c-type cytochrome
MKHISGFKQFLKVVLRCAVLGAVLAGGSVMAADASKVDAPKDLLLKGDAKCTGCHDEADDTGVASKTMLEARPSVLAIGKTRHGVKADGRNPTCTDCHGESNSHKDYKGGDKPPKADRTFGKKTTTPVQVRNDSCLTCHQRDAKRSHWEGSVHQTRDVACTSCHQVHAAHDKVRDKKTEAEVCFTCHKEQRVQVNKPSRHPIPEGKVACSDCHSPHGSAGPSMMVRDSVVDTCYTCHMEKRGPFVRNHQPVQEDCSICHNPHGTTNANLLKTRGPFLCQQCHEPTSHRGNVASLTGTSTGANTVARDCLNCHTQIHGTNNPINTSNERTFRR